MNKTIKIVLGIFAGVILLSGAFSGGFIVGHLFQFNTQFPFLNNNTPVSPVAPTVTSNEQSATPSELQTLFTPFWEAWNLVHKEYVTQPVDDVKLMQGAISGMLQSLGDKHTTYMDPQTYKDANSELSGSYEASAHMWIRPLIS